MLYAITRLLNIKFYFNHFILLSQNCDILINDKFTRKIEIDEVLLFFIRNIYVIRYYYLFICLVSQRLISY